MQTFSVVIATRNRAALLGATLEALAAQTWPASAVDIVVADNGSTDATRAVVSAAAARTEGPRVRYLFVPEPGKSAAVNRALTLATGTLIAFTDDDVCPEPEWLAHLARAFDDADVAFVAGRVRPAWECDPPPWVSPQVYGVLAVPENGDRRKAIDGPDADVVPIGANMAVRHEVLDRIGGFREDLGKLEGTLRTGEDHEFFLRMLQAGFRGLYEPLAVVHHRVGAERLHRSYFRRWLHQNGRDVARLTRVYVPDTSRRLLGVPRYLWRQAGVDLASWLSGLLRRNAAVRFGAAGRLLWFAGFLREAWFGPPGPHAAPHRSTLSPTV